MSKLFIRGILLFTIFLTACNTGVNSNEQVEPTAVSQSEPAPTEAVVEEVVEEEVAEVVTETAVPTDQPTIEPTEAIADEPTEAPVNPTEEPETELVEEEPEIIMEGNVIIGDDRPDQLRFITEPWGTDWERHTIDYNSILSGGPPRDGIPSVDEPKFITPDEAGEWLVDNEPVVVIELEGIARAYPIQILTWHEIVNDQIGTTPLIVTFCPLCNSALAFDRRVDDRVFEFGTSGLLRNSDLIMYDRTTESLWQQFTGEGIVGELAGRQLTFIPSAMVSFADFRAAHPEGEVLSRDTGFGDTYANRYGFNPYGGYDTIGRTPFLFDGEIDGRLQAVERVVTISFEDIDIAYPLITLSEIGAINDSPNGHDIVVFHKDGTSSALGDQVIALAEDVGATGVFNPVVDGQKLTFTRDGDNFVDAETGTTWNILGQATDGDLAGTQLEPIVHGDHFWFSWAAFRPETVIFTPEG